MSSRQPARSTSVILLIAPEGIEISTCRLLSVKRHVLLIAPEGIEISQQSCRHHTENYLLIAPEGIEMKAEFAKAIRRVCS